MNSPLPSKERIRLTITVTPEVHEVFTKVAQAMNMSLGRAMGEWLEDTSDAAAMAASMVDQAKQAPKDMIRQLNGITAALVAQNEEISERVMASAAKPVRADRREHAPARKAPSSLTGLNPPSKRKRA